MKTIMDLLNQLHPEFDYDQSDDFISDGLLDSIDIQELFAMLEEEYKIELAGTDLAPQNFRNIDTIRELLNSHGVSGDI
ncbi:MAG: acyl carrier protein [Selenomonadaceae bacterium]|nr:acyl carrier protein [Selenomonadaceae bacterium]MBR1859540.1 acyl carrier protein [Selenomonadaceae bacterium]